MKTLMNAWESHAVIEDSVLMKSMAFIVNAPLGSLGSYVKLILMTALESHVVIEEGVWMKL